MIILKNEKNEFLNLQMFYLVAIICFANKIILKKYIYKLIDYYVIFKTILNKIQKQYKIVYTSFKIKNLEIKIKNKKKSKN